MNKKRILIVEDETVVARDIHIQLLELNYEPVGKVRTGEEAIVLAGQLAPDLVLMDIQLAGQMDGVAAAQIIRDRFAIPVIFLTAFASDPVINRAKLTEPFGYIIKPFDERELRTVIEIALYKHQAERQQRASHEEMAAVIRTALDGYWVVDLAGRILEANDACCEMHGYAREEMLRMAIADFEVDEAPADIAEQIQQLIRAGSGRFERRHRRRDGGLIELEISTNYRPTAGGRFIAFLRDITARKRAERILQARLRLSERSATCSLEELLQNTLDEAEALTGSVIGFFHFVDADQKTLQLQTWSTNTLAKMCTAEGKGRHYDVAQAGVWVDCIGERRPVVHNDYASLPHRKGLPEGHAPIVRELVVPVIKDGLVTAIFGVGNKPQLYDEQDVETLMRLANLCWDIIARKRAEHARQLGEANLEALLNAATETIFMIDRAGTVLVANELSARRLGSSREELLGKCIFDYLPADIGGSRRERAESIFATGNPLRFTDQRAGRWLDQNLVPIRDARGNVASIAIFATDITESRKAEAALLAEQQRMNEIFQSAPIGIGTAIGRVITNVNDLFCEISGYPREEILGLSTRLLYATEEEFLRVGEAVRQMFASGRRHMTEARWRQKGGTLIDVEISAFPLHPGDGSPSLIFTVADITSRKTTENALRKSESRLRQAHKILKLGIWDWEIASDRTNWSGEMFAIYGITPETFTGRGQDYFACTHPDDRASQWANTQEALARTLTDGDAHLGVAPKQFRIIRPDGGIRWVEGDAEVVRDEAGEPVSMIGTLVDITERRVAEAALKESTLMLRKAQEVARIGSYKLDITTGIWSSSPQLDEIFGIDGDYVRDVKGWAALVAPAERREMSEYFSQHVLRDRQRFEKEYRIVRHSDGQERWVSGVGELEFDAGGNPVVMIGTIQDISARKALESQFRQAQKMEVIGQLAGGVAHDFNNILTAMTLNLELLRSTHASEAGTPLHELETMARRAAKLTQQLLMFARRQAIQTTTLELNGALAGLLQMLRRLLGEHINLKYVTSDSSLWIEVDAGMLDQAVINLCINARDAMSAGGTLTLATERVHFDAAAAEKIAEARPGAFACLQIGDTGCGMTADVMKHLFEPFFTTKEVGKGTGLGLASVHGIVHQHQGWVNVESVVGEGTTFRVYLPCSTKRTEAEAGAPDQAVRKGGSETILLVEDEEVVRKVSTKMLQKLGYRVLPAVDGHEALRLWHDHGGAIDLLFTDMVMPGGISGMELGEKLQRIKPELKIVLMSGYSAEIMKSETRSTLGVAFLPKPFESKTLATIIRHTLDGAN